MKIASGQLDESSRLAILRIVAGCFLLAFFLVRVAAPVADLDNWHEMALIRESVAAGRLIKTDIFAYTPTLHPVIDHEWGAGALLYFTMGAFGGWAVVALKFAIAFLTAHLQSRGWEIATDVLFTASCAGSCLAFLALFLRFARSRSSVFESLSRNSYGIYLVHYAFVSWLQLALVGASMPATLKFAVVTVGAVGGSWLTTIALRRVPAVARVV